MIESHHPHGHPCDVEHGHDHRFQGVDPRRDERRRLVWSVWITAAVMVVEVIGGFAANSLALISDAGHMLTHLLALSFSLFALIFSLRPATGRRSFGFYRLEILAALGNGVTLFLVTVWIFFSAYRRLKSPEPIESGMMFFIALAGLAANLLTAYLLSSVRFRNLNVRSAYFHMMGDTLSSVGVVAAAVLIYFTGRVIIDPLLSILLALFILFWSYRLVAESVDVLLEATPKEIDPARVAEAVKLFDEVRDVHDIHVWTLTSGMYALSAHVSVKNMPLSETSKVLRKINFLLCQRFNIGHCAIQFESEEARK